MLYAGQVLQIGPLEMTLDATEARVALPDMPEVAAPQPVAPSKLKDGYAGCISHAQRHAVWVCSFCGRHHCDECVRKLRRVGGAYLKFCPACSNVCKLSPWAEMMAGKKAGLIGKVVRKIRSSFKLTKQLLRH